MFQLDIKLNENVAHRIRTLTDSSFLLGVAEIVMVRKDWLNSLLSAFGVLIDGVSTSLQEICLDECEA